MKSNAMRKDKTVLEIRLKCESIYIYIHTYIHTYTHTHTHTHTPYRH